MSVNILWKWQTSNLFIGEGNLISFYGANYGDPIKVGEFQKSTHIRKSWTEDIQLDTSNNSMVNYAYVSDSEVSINGSYPMVLSGSTPSPGNGIRVTLKDESNIWAYKVIGVSVYAFSGYDTSVAVKGMEIYLFEFGQTRWQRLYGSSNPAILSQRTTPATSHTWEIAIAIKPTEVVDKTATIRLEADIQ